MATPPVRRREIFGWAMFDFANSSYTTLIITVAFGVYFTKVVDGGPSADEHWALGLTITNLIVMALSPVVGAVADDSGRKKLFLFVSYLVCVLGTATLYFAAPGAMALALVLLIISNVAFSFGENFAGAFLPEISTPENIGRISAFGWGIGYLGGLICLLLLRPFMDGLHWPAEQLLAPENRATYNDLRHVWLGTALFFLLAGIPTFALLRERAPRGPKRGLFEYATVGFRRLATTAREIRHFSELLRFLGAFFFYQAGLTAVIAFAGIFAERTLEFTANELIGLFLLLQLTSAIGAWVFGFVQDRLGGKTTISMTLVLWIGVCVACFFCTSKLQFWIIALIAGLGIGSLQSASRAMVGLFSPAAKSGEFFGFWGLAGKGAYAFGPLLFGWISARTGSQRWAILAVGALFLIGLIGIYFVDQRRGREEANAWDRRSTPTTSDAPEPVRETAAEPVTEPAPDLDREAD